MDAKQSWEKFLDEVADALDSYVTDLYRWPQVAVISAPIVDGEDQSGRSVRLTDLGDGTVLVRTGWSIELPVSYFIEEDGQPSQATQVVLGIADGDAAELAFVAPDDRWLAAGWRIRYRRGSLQQTPQGLVGIEAVRRIEPWPRRTTSQVQQW